QSGEADAGATDGPYAKSSKFHAATQSVPPRGSTRAPDAEMPIHLLERSRGDSSRRCNVHRGIDVDAVIASWLGVPHARARLSTCARPCGQPSAEPRIVLG